MNNKCRQASRNHYLHLSHPLQQRHKKIRKREKNNHTRTCLQQFYGRILIPCKQHDTEYAAAYGAMGAAVGVSVACGFGLLYLLLIRLIYAGTFKRPHSKWNCQNSQIMYNASYPIFYFPILLLVIHLGYFRRWLECFLAK